MKRGTVLKQEGPLSFGVSSTERENICPFRDSNKTMGLPCPQRQCYIDCSIISSSHSLNDLWLISVAPGQRHLKNHMETKAVVQCNQLFGSTRGFLWTGHFLPIVCEFLDSYHKNGQKLFHLWEHSSGFQPQLQTAPQKVCFLRGTFQSS